MKNLEEFYILGLPVETEIGECKFITVKDFPDCALDLQLVTLSKDHILNLYNNQFKNSPEAKPFLDELQRLSLIEIVFGTPEFREAYTNIFVKVFDEKVMERLTEENFTPIRKLILKMNCQKEEVVNPNPEIQRAIERSKRVKALDSEKMEFADIVTSVVGFNGLTYSDINNFTLYQLYMTFHRISHFKNYDTSTLFATVSSEKIKIESWNKHIDLFQEEKHFVTQDEFRKNTGSVFNG